MDKTLPERCYAFYCDAVTACRQQDGHRALTDPFLAAAGKLGFLVQEAAAHEGTAEALLRLREAEPLRREAAYWIDALEHGRFLKEADSIRLGAACGKIGRLIQAAIHEHTAFEDLAFAPFRKPRIFCQTPRLVLRRFVREDAETLLSFSKDEALCDSGWPSLTSRDEALEAITRWQWDTEYMTSPLRMASIVSGEDIMYSVSFKELYSSKEISTTPVSLPRLIITVSQSSITASM